MSELIALPFYWLIIGLLPTILLGTLFLGLFRVDTDEEKYLGSKICLISVILGAVIHYMELI
jgi:hypothetical protein